MAIYTKTRELTTGAAGAALSESHLTSHQNLDSEIQDISAALDGDIVIDGGDKLQINSAGDDKNIQVYHDDTNSYLTTSSGDLMIEANGAEVRIRNGNVLYVHSAGNDKAVTLEHNDTHAQLSSTSGAIIFSANADEIYADADNDTSFGVVSRRWSDVRSVLINGADIGFENNWKFREYPCTAKDIQDKKPEWFKENANKGIQLLDDNDKVIAVFTREGIYADIKPLSELK